MKFLDLELEKLDNIKNEHVRAKKEMFLFKKHFGINYLSAWKNYIELQAVNKINKELDEIVNRYGLK